VSPIDWLLDYPEGTIPLPRAGLPYRLPPQMRRRSEPRRVYAIDDRNAGQRYIQGNTELVVISAWTALDLLAGAPAREGKGWRPGAAIAEADGELRSQAAVCDVLGIGRTRLNALIKALPPEEYGAARLISKPDAAKKRRVWHEDVLEPWLDAAVAAEAKAGIRRGQDDAQPTVRRRRRTSAPTAGGSFKDLVRGRET